MGGGANAGSFFSGFGQAFGEALLTKKREQRRKKEKDEDIAIDLWSKVLTDPEKSDEERAAAGENLSKLLKNPDFKQMPGLMSQMKGPQMKPVAPQQQAPGQPVQPFEETWPETASPQQGSQGQQQQIPQMPIPPSGMGQGQQSPLYPSVTKGQPAQAPTNLITPDMPPRPPSLNSEAARRRFEILQQQMGMERFRTDENIRQSKTTSDYETQQKGQQLGQVVGHRILPSGDTEIQFLNPITGAATSKNIGPQTSEFQQKLLDLKNSGQQLSPDEQKQILFGIRPSGPEAAAMQDAKDWIDAKNRDSNIAGPAKLRLQEKRAQVNATQALTADRLTNMMQGGPGQQKKLEIKAKKEAISVFSGKFKQDFIKRKQQEHLQELQQLGEQATTEDPEIAQLLGSSKGNPQQLAIVAMKMAEKDAQQYFQQLSDLKKEDGGPQMVHIEEVRRKAQEAAAAGRDPNGIWDIYKSHNGQDIIIVGDDLEPWDGSQPEDREPLQPTGQFRKFRPSP